MGWVSNPPIERQKLYHWAFTTLSLVEGTEPSSNSNINISWSCWVELNSIQVVEESHPSDSHNTKYKSLTDSSSNNKVDLWEMSKPFGQQHSTSHQAKSNILWQWQCTGHWLRRTQPTYSNNSKVKITYRQTLNAIEFLTTTTVKHKLSNKPWTTRANCRQPPQPNASHTASKQWQSWSQSNLETKETTKYNW